jgi:hypothetical protein
MICAACRFGHCERCPRKWEVGFKGEYRRCECPQHLSGWYVVLVGVVSAVFVGLLSTYIWGCASGESLQSAQLAMPTFSSTTRQYASWCGPDCVCMNSLHTECAAISAMWPPEYPHFPYMVPGSVTPGPCTRCEQP